MTVPVDPTEEAKIFVRNQLGKAVEFNPTDHPDGTCIVWTQGESLTKGPNPKKWTWHK